MFTALNMQMLPEIIKYDFFIFLKKQGANKQGFIILLITLYFYNYFSNKVQKTNEHKILKNF